MGKTFKYLTAFVGIFLLTASLATAGSQPPVVGGVLPGFDLTVPKNVEHQKYLGVAGKTFTIPEIKAEVVIVEIFSMY
jgi:hypothetical protein